MVMATSLSRECCPVRQPFAYPSVSTMDSYDGDISDGEMVSSYLALFNRFESLGSDMALTTTCTGLCR